MYDTAIIGGGPAALSAALTLKVHNKSLLWIGSGRICEHVEKAERVVNYPGLPAVSGKDLAAAFRAQAAQMGLEMKDGVVNAILPNDDGFMLSMGMEVFDARTVLLATGAVTGGQLPGEAEHLGLGVSYCATCDGFLCQGKTLAVLDAAPQFDHEVEYLAEIAEKVFVYARHAPAWKAANILPLEAPFKRVLGKEDAVPEAGGGMEDGADVEAGAAGAFGEFGAFGEAPADDYARGVELANGRIIAADMVFLLRPQVALNSLISGLAVEDGHIAVDRAQRTNLPGCFAAGDCTGRPFQYTKAVGEGNVAAHSIIEYLAKF